MTSIKGQSPRISFDLTVLKREIKKKISKNITILSDCVIQEKIMSQNRPKKYQNHLALLYCSKYKNKNLKKYFKGLFHA